jgi:hypothetical protein
MAKFEITWQAPEFEYREKEVSWYWISIIVAALIIAFSVWQKDFLFGFFIVIAEILFIVWGNKVPKVILFRLTDTDLDIGGYKSHSLKEFESWSAQSDGVEWSDVIFYFRARLRTPLFVMVPDEKMPELRDSLKLVLKEIEHDPALVDSIEKFLHF